MKIKTDTDSLKLLLDVCETSVALDKYHSLTNAPNLSWKTRIKKFLNCFFIPEDDIFRYQECGLQGVERENAKTLRKLVNHIENFKFYFTPYISSVNIQIEFVSYDAQTIINLAKHFNIEIKTY